MEKTKAYVRLKLQWLLEHGFSLTDLINQLEAMFEDTHDTPLLELFKTWEYDVGFDSEIYPCLDEFLDCDYEFIN